MGWKYHSSLTPAQRAMLRKIEVDPSYTPQSSRTKSRLARLVALGYVTIGKRGRKKVDL